MSRAIQNSLAVALTGLLVHALSSCTSHFKLDLPVDHPARPESEASGALKMPDPFKVPSTSQPVTPMDESMKMPMDDSMTMPMDGSTNMDHTMDMKPKKSDQ